MFTRGDYSFTSPQYLDQAYRHSLLLKELDYLDGDVVCMQEVNPAYYKQTLLPDMARWGYYRETVDSLYYVHLLL